MLKVGESRQIRLNSNTSTQVFQFVLESEERFSVTPTIVKGKVEISLSTDPDGIRYDFSDDGTPLIEDNAYADSPYYLIVESLTDEAELSVVVH